MLPRAEETGQLRILLADLTLVSVFVRRTRSYVILVDQGAEFRVPKRLAREPSGWVQAWRDRHPTVAVKNWSYVDPLEPVPSYASGEVRGRRRRRRRRR